MAASQIDGELKKQILATDQHEDVKKFDPNPLLHAIKDVIQHMKGNASASEGHLDYKVEDMAYEAIKSVSCEFSCNCSGSSTTSDVAIRVLKSLGNYSWEAKAVITLAAFAANYGSCVSILQLYEKQDSFSKSTAFLQLSPNLFKQTPLKLESKTLGVVDAIYDLAIDIVEIKAFQSNYVQRKMFTSFVAAHEDDLAKAVYMSIQSTVACASILMNTIALGNEYKPITMELPNFTEQLGDIRNTLTREMGSWKKRIESIILIEDYEKLIDLFKREHTNNIEILQTLLCWNQSQLISIYNCSTTEQEELNKLSGKHVLLYFSNLKHLSKEEISLVLEYKKESTQYEIVWVPVVDESTSRNEENEKYFKETQDKMKWYTINDPWMLNKAVIKYIKKEWKFKRESELVVLNPKGEFVMSAAVNLLWVLERSRFEVNYWKTYQLLQETTGSKIAAGKHIFLFGGEDIKWIQKFVNHALGVAQAAEIDFVMMYAGKSNLKWEIYENSYKMLQEMSKTNTISGFKDQKNMLSFWATLRSICASKTTTGKSIVDSSTLDDIVTLLSFDGNCKKWAAICDGSSPKMAKARGETILDILEKYSKWGKDVKPPDFLNALLQKILEVKTPEDHHDCYSLEFAATTGSNPKEVQCSLCDRTMKTFITYRCCGDQ